MRVPPERLPPVVVPSVATKFFPLSARRIQQLAKQGRFPGARNFFGRWEIPTASLLAYLSAPRHKGGRGRRVQAVPE